MRALERRYASQPSSEGVRVEFADGSFIVSAKASRCRTAPSLHLVRDRLGQAHRRWARGSSLSQAACPPASAVVISLYSPRRRLSLSLPLSPSLSLSLPLGLAVALHPPRIRPPLLLRPVGTALDAPIASFLRPHLAGPIHRVPPFRSRSRSPLCACTQTRGEKLPTQSMLAFPARP